MISKTLAFLALLLVVSMASARRSSPSSRRAFLGRHRRVSIPKLFDNRQVINMVSCERIVAADGSTVMTGEAYSNAVRDELVYLSFHGF